MSDSPAFQPIDYYDSSRGGWGATRQTLLDRQLAAVALLRQATDGRRDGSLLDVGCGDGLFVAEMDQRLGLSQRSWRLCGVDYSAAKVEQARTRGYEFERCNLEEGLPFEDESFDVITAGELIEHLYDPDGFLAEMHRALRAGGHLLVTTPNLQAWYNRALFLFGIQPLFYETSTKSPLIGAGPLRRIKRGTIPVGHLRVFNRRALLDLLASQGFSVVSTGGAVFEQMPNAAVAVDRLFKRWPSMSSNLVVLARRD